MSDAFRDLPSAFDWELARITHRKHLPHLRQRNVIYFITFRLNDSLPESRRTELLKQRESWLNRNPLPHTPAQEMEYRQIWTARIENLLDSGLGDAVLKNHKCRDFLEATMRFEDGIKYQMGDFVIMPNHVHVLVRIGEGEELSLVLKSWKTISCKKINREMGRSGTLWMPETFDHVVRDENHLRRFVKYIRANPKKLEADHYTLGCGSLPRF